MFIFSLAGNEALGAGNQTKNLPAILQQNEGPGAPFLPDFSYAGYNNGMGDLPEANGTIVHVSDHGAVANDGKDDSRAIQAAIAHANIIEGPVIVRFGPGRFRVSEILNITRGHFTLQGAGVDSTILYFPRPLKHVDKSNSLDELREYIVSLDKRQKEPEKNINEFFSEYSWSGGFIWVEKPGTRPAAYLEKFDPPINQLTSILEGKRGDRELVVSDPSALNAGDVVQLQWINSEGPDAGIIHSLYGPNADMAGSHHWNFPQRPLVRQSTRVAAVNDNTITIGDPLLHDIGAEIPAQIAQWNHLVNVGIEGFHIEFPVSPYPGHHLELGYNGIYLTSSFDSWIRDIRLSNADAGILTYNSANITIRNIASEGNRGGHYAVHMGNVHNALAEQIRIFNPVIHSLTFNTQSTKCVYKDAEVFASPVLDQHAGSNHQNLFDNVTLHARAIPGEEGPEVKVFDGSGASYWEPGHGMFNTTWNLNVIIGEGAYADETVTIQGLKEGPAARIIGMHGNRTFNLDYRPQPYVENLNSAMSSVPSLYNFQLANRLNSESTE